MKQLKKGQLIIFKFKNSLEQTQKKMSAWVLKIMEDFIWVLVNEMMKNNWTWKNQIWVQFDIPNPKKSIKVRKNLNLTSLRSGFIFFFNVIRNQRRLLYYKWDIFLSFRDFLKMVYIHSHICDLWEKCFKWKEKRGIVPKFKYLN